MFLSLHKQFSMKKAIGVGLLLLANMVLLVHAVIPHHHHDKLPNLCNISYHQYDAVHRCQHFKDNIIVSENDENTHRSLSLEDCLLDNVYIRFMNESHTIQAAELGSDIDFHFALLYLSTDNSIRIGSDYDFLPFRQEPHLESLYTSFIAQSYGLRAPPLC